MIIRYVNDHILIFDSNQRVCIPPTKRRQSFFYTLTLVASFSRFYNRPKLSQLQYRLRVYVNPNLTLFEKCKIKTSEKNQRKMVKSEALHYKFGGPLAIVGKNLSV